MGRWRQALDMGLEEKHMKDMKKAVMARFFTGFAKYLLPWLHELTRRYKARGEFPVTALWLLPSYYQDEYDKEIAVLAASLIKDDERVMEHVDEFRQMMGDSPWEWFKMRGLVHLPLSGRTGGVRNRNIKQFFDTLYGMCIRNVGLNTRMIVSVKEDCRKNGVRFMKELMDEKSTGRLVLMVLRLSDGISCGLWRDMRTAVRCPLTEDVMRLLRTFFPEYMSYGTADEAIRLFGFDRDSDFFYAALAYKELCTIMPKECSRLATVYHKRFVERGRFSEYRWIGSEGIIPDYGDVFL